MGFFEKLTQPPPRDFPDRLAGEADPSQQVQRTGLILVGLWLLCLLPRAWMAWKLEAVCDDAYYYIFVADALRRGDFAVGFSYLNLNVYPAILILGHSLGFDWIVAGKLWGVLVSSLTVLPLFGWVRRLFDDRVAMAACFLYAVHSEMIECSVEPIREATFWFFLTLCLYLTCRAVLEIKLRYFALAGLTLVLAQQTRNEGWFLVVPLLVWAVCRWRGLSSEHLQSGNQSCSAPSHRDFGGERDSRKHRPHRGRSRLIAGTLIWLGATPCLLLLVNLTLLSQHSRWEWGRFNHLSIAWQWLHSANTPLADANSPASITVFPAENSSAQTGPNQESGMPSPDAERAVSGTARLWRFLKELVFTLDPVNLLSMLAGSFVWRHLLLQRDKLPLLLMGSLILSAIWIYLSHYGVINGRYFLTLFLIFAPFEGMILLFFLHVVGRIAHRLARSTSRRVALVTGYLVLIAAISWTDALTACHDQRASHLEIARQIRLTSDSFQSVASDFAAIRVGYSTGGTVPTILFDYASLYEQFADNPPEVLILSQRIIPPDQLSAALESAARLGLHRLDPSMLPSTNCELIVLTHPAPIPVADRNPTKNTRRQ